MSTVVDPTPEEVRGKGLDAAGRRRPYRHIRRDQYLISRDELREQFGDDAKIDPEDDRIAWRRRIRTNPALAPLYRIGVATLGLLLIVAGIPMVPLVGPGWVVIFLGLFLWSTEFIWARRVTQFVKAEVRTFEQWARHAPLKIKIPLVIASIVFGWFCFYLVLLLLGVPGWVPEPVDGWLAMLPGLG